MGGIIDSPYVFARIDLWIVNSGIWSETSKQKFIWKVSQFHRICCRLQGQVLVLENGDWLWFGMCSSGLRHTWALIYLSHWNAGSARPSKLLQKPTARWEMAHGSPWYSNLSDQESDWLNCGVVFTATIIYYGSIDKIKSDQICQAVKKTDRLLLPKLRWPSFPGCNWHPLSSSSRQKSTQRLWIRQQQRVLGSLSRFQRALTICQGSAKAICHITSTNQTWPSALEQPFSSMKTTATASSRSPQLQRATSSSCWGIPSLVAQSTCFRPSASHTITMHCPTNASWRWCSPSSWRSSLPKPLGQEENHTTGVPQVVWRREPGSASRTS